MTRHHAQLLNWRLLVCHKHPLSARLHFLIPQREGVVLPRPLPPLAVFAESAADNRIQAHPASALRHLQEDLGVRHVLQCIGEFQVSLQVPGMLIPVYLVALLGYDLCSPPLGTRWIELTQCIGMPWLDRELLRRAYQVLIG